MYQRVCDVGLVFGSHLFLDLGDPWGGAVWEGGVIGLVMGLRLRWRVTSARG